ncbi:MAG: MarR family transcriptional regulator [Saprospiraceae bacterium]|nr:MarR family transcriptional regulator [Saprospiraceae bacterium]
MENILYTRAFNKMLKTSSIMEQKVRRILKPYGMTHVQYHILKFLSYSHPSPRSPKDIKEDLVISSPDVTRILDRLVEKKWVLRKTCESNRRKVDVSISDEGRNKFENAHSELQDGIYSFLSTRLSEQDIHQLMTLISKIDEVPSNLNSTFNSLLR